MSGLHQSDLETRQLQKIYIIAFSDLYVYRTQVSGCVIFTCRFRLLLVDSTFPQIVQVVLPSCTAWWFDKLLGLSNLLSHCGHWQRPCFSQEPLRYADPRLPRKSQFHRGRPAAGRRMKKLKNHAGFWEIYIAPEIHWFRQTLDQSWPRLWWDAFMCLARLLLVDSTFPHC